MEPNSGGGSAIIGPNGEYLAGPKNNDEGLVVAEINLDDALPGKQAHNVLGHYSRFDVLSLNFNQQRLSPFSTRITGEDADIRPGNELKQVREELAELKKRLDEHIDQKKL